MIQLLNIGRLDYANLLVANGGLGVFIIDVVITASGTFLQAFSDIHELSKKVVCRATSRFICFYFTVKV